jgi:hypothetical protein
MIKTDLVTSMAMGRRFKGGRFTLMKHREIYSGHGKKAMNQQRKHLIWIDRFDKSLPLPRANM